MSLIMMQWLCSAGEALAVMIAVACWQHACSTWNDIERLIQILECWSVLSAWSHEQGLPEIFASPFCILNVW